MTSRRQWPAREFEKAKKKGGGGKEEIKKKKSIGHRAENRELFKMQPRSISWMESGSQR